MQFVIIFVLNVLVLGSLGSVTGRLEEERIHKKKL